MRAALGHKDEGNGRSAFRNPVTRHLWWVALRPGARADSSGPVVVVGDHSSFTPRQAPVGPETRRNRVREVFGLRATGGDASTSTALPSSLTARLLHGTADDPSALAHASDKLLEHQRIGQAPSSGG